MSNKASQTARQHRLSILAKAPAERVEALWHALALDPDHQVLRAPEIGTVMVRGRAGATGAAFNLGEVTVARCSVELIDGTVGHGYVQGRSLAAAKIVALVDALAEAGDPRMDTDMVAPLEREAAELRDTRAAKAAATRVEFFTMAREASG